MKVIVNGEERDVEAAASLSQLLKELGTPERGIAVARNDAVVRRAQFDTIHLCEGDRIEIIQAVAGG